MSVMELATGSVVALIALTNPANIGYLWLPMLDNSSCRISIYRRIILLLIENKSGKI